MSDELSLTQLCDLNDVTITELDSLPTQDFLEFKPSKSFKNVEVATDEQLQQRRIERIPVKTRKQNSWAMSCYVEWAEWRNTQAETLLGDGGLVPATLGNQSLYSMDYWLSRFIIECRRKDGSFYPPNTLYNIAASVQRTLREVHGRSDVNMFDLKDTHFAEFRKQLDSRMKELTNQGVGIHRNRADPVTDEDEMKLWDTGVIGYANAKSLSYAVFCYNCKIFGFRGGDEHRNLDVNQYSIRFENGDKVLVFEGRHSKNVQGGLHQRKVEPKVVKQHCMAGNPRCVVSLFETYFDNIPKSGPFYRKPLPPKLTRSIVFSSQCVGVNTISKYMKDMFTEAGIDTEGRNIRNHSGKVTLCTNLYAQNFDEQAIMGRSGHRSTAVRDYKRPSETLQKAISDAVQPPLPAKLPKPEPTLTVTCTSEAENRIEQPSLYNTPNTSVAVHVPDCITTVVIVKNGQKISVSL